MHHTALSAQNPSGIKARLWIAAGLCCLLLLAASPPSAQESEEEAAQGDIYVPLASPLVVNYGGPGRLKYLKAEISLRVEASAEAAVLRHHMPLIRHKMVLLFSRQEEQTVNTQEGRETLRLAALEEVNAALAAEEGEQGLVQDLLFSSFVVQR